MSFIAMTSTYPGYWGAGDTDIEAVKNCRSQGGTSAIPGILLEIDPFYVDAYVDMMGTPCAYASDPEVPFNERPKMIVQAWRVGKRGARTPIKF